LGLKLKKIIGGVSLRTATLSAWTVARSRRLYGSCGGHDAGDDLVLPSAPPLVQSQPSSTLLRVIDRRGGRNSSAVCGIATDGVEVN